MTGAEKLKVAKKEAARTYRAELKKDPEGYPYSPAEATKNAAKKSGLPASRLVPVVAAIYYAMNGELSPIAGTGKRLATAIRKRRDAGGRLARWEVIAASLAAGENGRESWSIPSIRALYTSGGGDIESSYTGRGTRVAAPSTREDETAEVASA